MFCRLPMCDCNWIGLLVVFVLGVVAPTSASAQAPCTLGQGLVILDSSPPADSARAFNFVDSVMPEDTTGVGVFVGTPTERTLLLYGVPVFHFSAPGVVDDSRHGLQMPQTAYTMFSDSVWFVPFLREPHMATLSLRWTQAEGDWVRAVTNDSTGEALWIRRGLHVAAYTWADLFVAADHVGRTSTGSSHDPLHIEYTQPLRSAPSDSASSVEASGTHDCFHVEEVRGDWLRVRGAEDCGMMRPSTEGAWWIRWCRGDELVAWPGLKGGFGELIRAAAR